MKTLLISLTAAALTLTAQVAPPPGWAVFDVPGLESAAGTAVDVSYLNTEPAGIHGFIRVKDGHFVDNRNTPLRFYGTNLTGDACFPSKADAPKLAKRLRQFGFNCLRLHFMDTNWHKGAIWQNPETCTPSEENLQKLDTFIAACIQEGIYLNVNLHVARVYPNSKGITDRTFTMGKVLDRWYPPFIKHQEDYAAMLLNRVNTVTGLRYAETPGIMCVELNNENSMIQDFRQAAEKLPKHFQDELAAQWTRWLKRKYGTDEAVRAVWDRHVSPLGETVITDAKGWYAENAGGAASTLTPLDEADKTAGWRWVTTKQGNAEWNLQLEIKDFKLEPGPYTVTFQARSASSSKLVHHIMLCAPPWQNLGLRRTIELTPEWQDFEFFDVVPEAVNDNPHRVNFSIQNKLGDMEIRHYTIRRGGGHGFPQDHTLATGMPIPGSEARIDQMLDFFAFLIDTEMATTRRLRDYVKNTIGCKMPVTDTQVNYGLLGGLKRESTLSDYIDIHAYWEHPSYTRNDKGQVTSFSIPNTAAVANAGGGCIPALAPSRVKDMPFSISEYNAPAPNDHNADMFPLFSVWASIQNWDAFFSYTYRDFGTDYGNTFIRGYFQFIGRASMLVHIPFATLLYRQHLMPAATTETILGIPSKDITKLAQQRLTMHNIFTKLGGNGIAPASQAISCRIDDTIDAPKFLVGDGKAIFDETGAAVSADGSYRIHPKDPDGACATLNLPSARLVTGHIAGRSFKLGDVSVSIASRPWPRPLPAFSCISMIALDGAPIASSHKILLAASARTENTDMQWNEKRTGLIGSGRERWGKAPVISELVPATISLPGDAPVKLSVLDPQGRPVSSRTVAPTAVAITAEDKSLWFLLER